MEYSTAIYSTALNVLDRYDSLQHHGIFGMKWGVRRYQNEDGTLTPAGRKRYLTGEMVVDENGNSLLVGDADARRRDLEAWNEKDAAKALNTNKSYNIGNAIGLGGIAAGGLLGTMGAMKLADPMLATFALGGGALTAALGFGIGSHKALKETGLDDPARWQAKNTQKYKIDTSELGTDIRWLNNQQLAKLRNQQYYADNDDYYWDD